MAFASALNQAARRQLATRSPILLSSRHASTSTSSAQPSSFRTWVSAATLLTTGTILAIYYFDSRSALHKYAIMPIVRSSMDPEAGHKLAVKVLASGFAPRDTHADELSLGAELWGRRISNPIGMAAGFDKDGEATEGLFNLGFGWVEIGSITPKPQEGNPRPRVFHLPEDDAIINRYGFPSQGHAVVLGRLRSYLGAHPPSSKSNTILAVNLGKNKSSSPDSTSDFITGVSKFGPLADVLVINVSSPNTPGLRGLQGRGVLEELLSEVTKARNALPERSPEEWKWSKPKIVVKIAPDLDEHQIEDIAEAVKTSGIDGVIVSNTTVQRPESLQSINGIETGGLSGPPLKALSLKALKQLRGQLPSSVPIIGCGGISSGADALEFASNGANLVQLYTSFAYDGVGTPRRIKDEIAAELKARNATWSDLVSTSVEALSYKPQPPPKLKDVLKRQTEQIRAALDEAGKRIALGDELVLLKEKAQDTIPLLSAKVPSSQPQQEQSPSEEKKSLESKTLQELVKEVEAALGIVQAP